MKRGRRIWRIVRIVWISAGLAATAIFTGWSLVAYRASNAARAAMHSDARVAVRDLPDRITFTPSAARAGAAELVFFAGALVDPRAYAPLARHVARQGNPAVIVKLPRRGAFGGADSPALRARIADVLAGRPADAAIVMAGHSRGAVVAADVAGTRTAAVDGLVLIGSSHPRDIDLGALTMPVTKVVGTRDGLASPAEVRQNAHLLPAHTHWVWVEGGNHSQFGWYGFQPMDRTARVDAATQRRIMTRAVLDVLNRVQTAR